jgi:hypothetical protein
VAVAVMPSGVIMVTPSVAVEVVHLADHRSPPPLPPLLLVRPFVALPGFVVEATPEQVSKRFSPDIA